MAILPVIIGMGGINSAGRSSGFHSYKRIVCDVLPEDVLHSTWSDLAYRMGLARDKITSELIDAIKNGTLIRRIDSFDPQQVTFHQKTRLDDLEHAPTLIFKKSKLPRTLPKGWILYDLENNEVAVKIPHPIELLFPDKIQISVSSGGNLPSGFDPGKLYNSHHHPRGLSLTIYGASDLLNSLGLEWETIFHYIRPDEISVYAGSALSQVDDNSLGGLFSAGLMGNRINSKMLPLSLSQMPADFVNSYVINSAGTTGTNTGACATFLYNLRQAALDIQTGKAKIAIAGSAEAPLVPEIIEGFRAMGALATDEALCALDNIQQVNHRRACRPFSTNAGFTIAEASQFVILMNDELALSIGMNILGSVADVFINADANKKSITKPGIGNYITVAKTVALAKAILGQEGLQRTYVQAHGPGTEQNRVTESHILNETAKAFGIQQWPVTAIKSYVGHSISAAGGDQLVSSLGVWRFGWIPGIKSIDHIASDVHTSHLNILTNHLFVGDNGQDIQAVFINSKGFGGNNATALILSPQKTLDMLEHKFGKASLRTYWEKNQSVKAASELTDQQTCLGNEKITYQFGTAVMDEHSITFSESSLTLSQFINSVELSNVSPYYDYI